MAFPVGFRFWQVNDGEKIKSVLRSTFMHSFNQLFINSFSSLFIHSLNPPRHPIRQVLLALLYTPEISSLLELTQPVSRRTRTEPKLVSLCCAAPLDKETTTGPYRLRKQDEQSHRRRGNLHLLKRNHLVKGLHGLATVWSAVYMEFTYFSHETVIITSILRMTKRRLR